MIGLFVRSVLLLGAIVAVPCSLLIFALAASGNPMVGYAAVLSIVSCTVTVLPFGWLATRLSDPTILAMNTQIMMDGSLSIWMRALIPIVAVTVVAATCIALFTEPTTRHFWALASAFAFANAICFSTHFYKSLIRGKH